VLTQHVPIQRRLVHLGDVLFRAGDAFRNVYLLRCGSCKLLGVGADGREQLVSLLFKGDWLGFEGIAEGRYACDAVAIDTGEIWSIRYDTLLHAAMSREIARERDATAAHFTLPADAKVANFLYHLGRRLQRSGLRADPITLRVTRAEIGTHLGLTLESVSRALTRLVRENVIRFGESSRRELHIARLPALQEFVRRRDN
jgi:CRP/FNR family transcriptional regulator